MQATEQDTGGLIPTAGAMTAKKKPAQPGGREEASRGRSRRVVGGKCNRSVRKSETNHNPKNWVSIPCYEYHFYSYEDWSEYIQV
jgi:hypothetical protein